MIRLVFWFCSGLVLTLRAVLCCGADAARLRGHEPAGRKHPAECSQASLPIHRRMLALVNRFVGFPTAAIVRFIHVFSFACPNPEGDANGIVPCPNYTPPSFRATKANNARLFFML